MKKTNFNQTETEKPMVLVCPNCHKSTAKCSPFYRHMFDQKMFGYFLKCPNCLKQSFIQIIYPWILREGYFPVNE